MRPRDIYLADAEAATISKRYHFSVTVAPPMLRFPAMLTGDEIHAFIYLAFHCWYYRSPSSRRFLSLPDDYVVDHQLRRKSQHDVADFLLLLSPPRPARLRFQNAPFQRGQHFSVSLLSDV
jgi:hypothetical protein